MEEQNQEVKGDAPPPMHTSGDAAHLKHGDCHAQNIDEKGTAKKLTPVQKFRERHTEENPRQKTLMYWLGYIGVEDESVFIWSFVSSLMVFYLRAPGLFYLAGICMFSAWFWKGTTLKKDYFIAIFAALVVSLVFAHVFGIGSSQFGRMQMGGPVTEFQCRQMKNGNFECQFFPLPQQQQQQQYQNRNGRRVHQYHATGQQKRKKK